MNTIKKFEPISAEEHTEIGTERLFFLVKELDKVRRVGGAWAIFIANPGLYSAIYSVYEQLVDSFDDDELYLVSAYFLMRTVMKMHSEEFSIIF